MTTPTRKFEAVRTGGAAACSADPGGGRIAALLLGSIEAPHEACSQPSRAYEVTYKWSVMSLLRDIYMRLADPVHLSSTGRDGTAHPVHGLGTRVTRSNAIVGGSISTRLTFRSSPD